MKQLELMRSACRVGFGLRNFSALMLLLFIPLFLSGCPVTHFLPWDTTEDLQIALSDIELQEIKALETIFLLTLRIINPNDKAIEPP